MTDGLLKQINVLATPEVKARLAQLEADLQDDAAEKYEIVGVLIKRASAKSVPSADLKTYRAEFRAAKTAVES